MLNPIVTLDVGLVSTEQTQFDSTIQVCDYPSEGVIFLQLGRYSGLLLQFKATLFRIGVLVEALRKNFDV